MKKIGDWSSLTGRNFPSLHSNLEGTGEGTENGEPSLLQKIFNYLENCSLDECLSCTSLYIGVAISVCLVATQSACLIGLWCYATRLRKCGIRLHMEFSEMKQRMSLCEQSALQVSNAAREWVVAAAAAISPIRAPPKFQSRFK